MKLGINLLCLTDFVEERHLDNIGRLRDLGYDGVEVPVLSGKVSHYERLGRELDGLGLGRSTTSIVPTPEANPVSCDAEVRARGLSHLDWALDCAIALGAESMGGPFHAPIGFFTGRGASEDELKYGADAHHALAERAAANGMHLSLEPLNRFETYFLNTMEQARAYVDRVAHPAFKIMYDTFHANVEERRPEAAIRLIGQDIGVFHVSENDRGIPGRGHIEFGAMFTVLKELGYDGWLTLEAFGAGLPAIATATRVWRPLFPDFDTLFSESATFIRKTWAAA
ncbi:MULTISPECIES: sugar phosphate isomerase/epimerase family protein [Ensifer]|uniref:Sugar phosphate isomerase/epimerase n=1 Tax=Ensifer adhaerens TaxID=106592 RepID=A0ABY8HR85_ENSAD|nr:MULTISPECIES: sugar phosphate isomerase/epimerase family protein [Ensifer]ANK77360.1 isomerase [Ensifer adhaerens]KDP74259.1 isomerase [Ensifer adhaerens]KQZ42057.1 isomerase [Ensifer sp. Root558]QHG74810.1 sugar phosphate isomerase/epimerase [Ensifer adhaerens]WFP94623.1 sugar phosphate isomerase/epimerase [Ensifer adhaerens]